MKKHDYHFIITSNLKKELNKIPELKNYSFSRKVIFIISRYENVVNYLKILKIDEHSNVEYLESAKNIHLYMKKSLYKKIKVYHGKFNIYSMALLVRKMIRLFLKMVEEYGFHRALKKLKKVKQKLKKINNIGSRNYKIIQLLYFLGLQGNKNLKLELILSKLLL